MPRKFFMMLAAAILLNATAEARLGETAAECAKRYGTPVFTSVNPDFPAEAINGYIKNDFNILITFNAAGKANSIAYTEPDREAPEYQAAQNDKGWADTCFTPIADVNRPIPHRDIAALLKANQGDGHWRALFAHDAWVRETNTMAEYVQSVNVFIVADVASLIHTQRQQRSMEGF